MFVKQWSSKYVSAFRYVPSDPAMLIEKGEIFCLINLIVKTSYPVDRIMKMIWDGLIDEYIYSQGGPLESLKRAIRAGEKKAISLIKNDKELEAAAVNLSYTMLVVKESNLYLARLGEHSVRLWRNGKYINLTEILDKHNVDAGSAMIEADDTVMVTAGEIGKLIPLQAFSAERVEKLTGLMSDSEGVILMSGKEIVLPEFTMKNGDKHTPEGIEKPALLAESMESDKDENIDDAIKEEIETEVKEIPEFETDDNDDELPKQSYSDMITHQKQVLEAQNSQSTEAEESIEEAVESENSVVESDGVEESDVTRNELPEINDVPNYPLKRTELGAARPTYIGDDKPAGLKENAGKIANRVKQLELKNKAKSVFEKVGKSAPVIKKIANAILMVLGKIADKIGSAFSALGGKIKQITDNAFGRKLWYKRFMSRVSQTRLSIGGSDVRGMKVDYYRERNLKRRRFGLAFLVVAVVILLVLGINYTKKVQHESEVNAQVATYLVDAKNYLDSADRNSKDKKDDATLDLLHAQDQIKKAEDKVAAEKITLSDTNQQSLSDLKSKQQGINDSINRVIGISEKNNKIELMLDTKLSFGDKAQPTDLTIYRNATQNEFLFVSDKGEKGVFRVSLVDKKVLKLPDSGKVLASPQFVSAGVSGIYVYDSGVGMVRSGFKTDGGFDDVSKLTGLGADAFSGKNISSMMMLQETDAIYLLDRSTGTMIRSLRNVPDYTYGLLQSKYENQGFALGNKIVADDMNIIVLASGTQGLVRYSGGAEQPAAITQATPSVQDLTTGYAMELGVGKLYVYDKPNKRILKLEKPLDSSTDQLHPGEYVMLQQYVYRGDRDDVFNDVKSLVVDSSEKYMYVLDGLKIWKIAL